MSDVVKRIKSPRFHAAHFVFEGTQFIFSGWWVLDWVTGYKDYESIDEFLDDPIFNGKKLEDVADQLTDVWYETEPY